VPTGSGGSPTITTNDAITYWLNQGAAVLARSCVPVFGTGYASLTNPATGTTGVRDVFLGTLTSGAGQISGGTLWAARGVTWGTGTLTQLTHCSRSALELANPQWQVTAAATPLYWFDEGQGNIGIFPYPTNGSGSSGTLTVAGLVIPPPLGDGTSGTVTSVTWLPDDMCRLLTWYAAVQIAEKNFEDPSLAGRAPMYKADWLDGCMRMWERIDLLLRQAHFPSPPQAMQMQAAPQGGGNGA